VHDDDRIVIVRRDGLDQRITVLPCREVLPVCNACTNLSWISKNKERLEGVRAGFCLPVARVAIYGDIFLTRIGLQKYDCDLLMSGSGGGGNKVKVIEKPRESRVVLPRSRLQCLVWLFNDPR
jgi:hypothetical protein